MIFEIMEVLLSIQTRSP